jgi:hypothetical protein
MEDPCQIFKHVFPLLSNNFQKFVVKHYCISISNVYIKMLKTYYVEQNKLQAAN